MKGMFFLKSPFVFFLFVLNYEYSNWQLMRYKCCALRHSGLFMSLQPSSSALDFSNTRPIIMPKSIHTRKHFAFPYCYLQRLRLQKMLDLKKTNFNPIFWGRQLNKTKLEVSESQILKVKEITPKHLDWVVGRLQCQEVLQTKQLTMRQMQSGDGLDGTRV